VTSPCTITNNVTTPVPTTTTAQTGWDGSIVVINAYNPSSTSSEQGYEQTLQLLQFSGGEDALSAQSNGAIMLDQALYDLIIAQSNNLFPVRDVAELSGLTPPYIYPSIAVCNSDSAACANAMLFYQDITAFPTSNLAKQFNQVMTQAGQSGSSAADIEKAINTFFQGTKQYENVTFSAYIATTTYLATFANAWANFASTYTYYLYRSSGTPAGSGATSAGIVTLVRTPGDSVPSPTDTSGGYTISYSFIGLPTPPTPLYFSSQQLVSSTSEDIPPICLQCSYAQLSQFTGKASDATNLVPIIFGNWNGQQVIGVSYDQPNDPDFIASVENFFNSKGMQLLFQILGLVMAAKMIGEGISWLQGKLAKTQQENGGEAPNAQQLQEAQGQAAQVEGQIQAAEQGVANRLDAGVQVLAVEQIPDVQDMVQQAAEQEAVEDQVQEEEGELQAEDEEIEALAEVGVNQPLENVATDVRNESSELDAIDPSQDPAAESKLEAVEGEIGTDNKSLEQIAEQDAGDLSEQEQQTVEQSTAKEQQEQEEQEEEASEEGDIVEGDDVGDLDG
jgi:hypothetical protein